MQVATAMREAGLEAGLTLAECDAFVGADPRGGVVSAVGVVVRQPGESTECVLQRVRRNARALREAGYRITSARLVVGADDAARLDERLELARGLIQLIPEESSSLHLVATRGPAQQKHLLDLAGWLLAGWLDGSGHGSHKVHLTFLEAGGTSRPAALSSRPASTSHAPHASVPAG